MNYENFKIADSEYISKSGHSRFIKRTLNACPAASRQKSLVRIEVTTLRIRHSDGTVDNTSRKEVFYRRPLLTNKGKLDRDRLALEILLRR